MKAPLTVKVNGHETKVRAEVIEKKIWFKLNDAVYSYELTDLESRNFKGAKSTAKSPDKILAPMPGKVTKVFISENQQVKKGDALLVMEAMKMEYTLKADIPASVQKVLTQVGDQVTLGFLLVQLKEIKQG